jgi:hypothetical protein
MDRYIDLFTDFGFKKVFGEEPNKDLLISFLNTLLPARHQIAELEFSRNEWQGVSVLAGTFQELFHAAGLTAFKPQERDAYQASLKYYRDLKNVIDTAYGDGLIAGREERRKKRYEERLALGLQKGESLALQKLLRKRFGEIPDELMAKINDGTVLELERWLERVFDAKEIGAVFEAD